MYLNPLRVVVSDHSLMGVSLLRLKEHLRILDDDEDALFTQYIQAATAYAEIWMGRVVLPATLEAIFNTCCSCTPQHLKLTGRKFTGITKIEVLQEGVYVELTTDQYVITRETWETLICINDDVEIDCTVENGCQTNPETVKVTYTVGETRTVNITDITFTGQIGHTVTNVNHKLVTGDQVLQSDIIQISPTQVAPQLNSQTFINDMVEFEGELYGATQLDGRLFKWDETNLVWIEVAPQLGTQTFILSLAVFDGKIYGGTGSNGLLYEFNGTNAWVEVAASLNGQTAISSLVVHNGILYGGTQGGGRLFKWDGVSAWEEKAGEFLGQGFINKLLVFQGTLYASTGPNGYLFKWNGLTTWVAVSTALGSEFVKDIIEFEGEIYGGTQTTGNLYKSDGVSDWVLVAPVVDNQSLFSLAVFHGVLYTGTSFSGSLFKLNEAKTALETVIQGPFLGEAIINTLLVFKDNLYGGTGNFGTLVQFFDVIESVFDGVFEITVTSQNTYDFTFVGTATENATGGLATIPIIPPQIEVGILQMVTKMNANKGDCCDKCGQVPCSTQVLLKQFKRVIVRGAGRNYDCCCG